MYGQELSKKPPLPDDDDVDSWMQRRTKAPAVKPSADDGDVDSFMQQRSATPALKPLSPKREAIRQNVIGLQRELTKPQNQLKPGETLDLVSGQKFPTRTEPFQSPVSMDFRGSTDAQKLADRALQPTAQPKPLPRPKNVFQAPVDRRTRVEKFQDDQAANPQYTTVETDPAKLDQMRGDTQRREMAAKQERNATIRKVAGALNPAVNLGNTLNDAGVVDVNRVLQSGQKGIGQMVRGGATALPYAFPAVDALSKLTTGKPLRDYTEGLGRAQEGAISNIAETITPENPTDQSFRAKLARGAGSLIPSVGGALATGGGSLAAGALGALTNLGQVASERDKAGVPVSDVRRVSSDALAAATGMTEALGVGRLLNRLGLKTSVVQRVAQMVEEGGQEYAQDYLNDINAKLVAAHDPQRRIDDPLAAKRLEAAAIGAILGGAGEVADITGQRVQQGLQDRAIAQTRAAIDQRSAANAEAIRPAQTAAATQSATEPLAEPLASAVESNPVNPATSATPQPSTLLTENLKRRAMLLGEELPGIQELIKKPDSGQISTETPINTVDPQVDQKGQTAPLPAPQTVTGALRAEADAAKIEAAEFEQAGDFGQAAQAYDTTHKNLKLMRRKLGVPKTPEDVARINQVDREISIAASNRQRATVQARQMARQANAPTAPVSRQVPPVSRPEAQNIAPIAVSSLQSESLVAPKPSAPIEQAAPVERPTGNTVDFTPKPSRARGGMDTENLTVAGMLKRRFPEGIRVADKGEARNLGGREGNALVGLVNKNSRTGIDDAAYALHEEGLRLPDGRPFVEDGRIVATEADVLDFIRTNGKQKVGGTKSLAKSLEQEEAAYYGAMEKPSEPFSGAVKRMAESGTSGLSPNFDEIVADVDSDTGALRRAIDRSSERGHVAPEPGKGVSLSPYADMVARNQDAVNRLYDVGLNTPESRQTIADLRKFAQQNGIEARHIGNLLNDVRNFQMEKAFWQDQGLDLSTVQKSVESLDAEIETTRGLIAKLPDVARTEAEREIAALDSLFDDADAVNLLERAAGGDNNARDEFQRTATEYGISGETAADLIRVRRPSRSDLPRRVPEISARQSDARNPRTSQESRRPSEDEFDLLNTNPVRLQDDDFDAHLRTVEDLRNKEIRGIVKLTKDETRLLRQHLKNLNEERQIRVKAKRLGAKNEPRHMPTMDERRARWAEEQKQQPNDIKFDKFATDEADSLREEWSILRTFGEDNMEGALENARIQASSDPANNRAGILYVNSNAKLVIDKVWSANGGVDFSAAVALDTSALEAVADVLRHEASFLEGSEAKQVTALADAFFGMVSDRYDGAGLINVDLAKHGYLELARNHELFHVWQYGQSQPNNPNRKPMDVAWAEKVNGYEKVRATLIEKGYPDDAEDIVREFAAYAATNDLERLGFSKQEAETVATDFLYEYFTQISKQYGAEHLERIGRVSIPARSVIERVRNEVRTTQTASGTAREGRTGQPETGSSRGVAVSRISLSDRREAGGRAGRETGTPAQTQAKEKRASFGSLANEPRGQIAASGLGGLQSLLDRKPKAAAPVEKDWNPEQWARKFYTDAALNSLTPEDRARYSQAKTPKEKAAILMHANLDPDFESKLFKMVDDAAAAFAKGDLQETGKIVAEGRKLLSGQISDKGRDVNWFDHMRSRLSNVNFKGTYERLAGQQGKEISEIFRNAQVDTATGKISRAAAVRRLHKELKPYTRRLNAAGKPGLARWIEHHIDAVSDPDQSFRGLAGFLKGFQYNTKLRLNPRSAIVNSLQPLQTLWPHLTTREFAKLQIEAMKPATRKRIGELAASESGGSVEGVDNRNKWLAKIDLFSPVSEYNRIVGHLAGELFADRNGLTGDAKARMAADWAKKVEFDNSAYDIPPLFSGKIAGVVGQFKPFMVKNLERIYSDWESAPPEALATNTWKGAGTLARRSKMVAAQLAIGGVRSAVPGLKMIGGVVILGALAKAFSSAGMDDDKAEKMAEAVYFGAPGLIEQDLSGSVMIFDEPFGKTAYEKAVNFFGGPTLSLITKAWEEGKAIHNAEDTKKSSKEDKQKAAGLRLAKAITPYTKTALALRAAYKGERPELSLDKNTPMTLPEAIGYGLQGTPLRQTKYWEKKEAPDFAKQIMPEMFPKEEEKKGTRITEDGKIQASTPKQRKGEPEAVYKQRVERVQTWMDTYGQKLLDSPRYKMLTADEQKAAIELLRDRIGRQQNLKRPNEAAFAPNSVLLGIKKSAAGKAKRDRKYLYVQP